MHLPVEVWLILICCLGSGIEHLNFAFDPVLCRRVHTEDLLLVDFGEMVEKCTRRERTKVLLLLLVYLTFSD